MKARGDDLTIKHDIDICVAAYIPTMWNDETGAGSQ
jgi:hypothetical protein